MGKSKFPGKPSKLAGKKKIRILTQAEISTSNQQQNGATIPTAAASTASNNVSPNCNSPNFLEQVNNYDEINGIKHQTELHNCIIM